MSVSTIVLIGRLAQLQIIDHSEYRSQAQLTHTGTETLIGRRGAILDRNGYPLAASEDTYDLMVERRAWTDPNEATQAAAKLSAVVSRPPEEMVRAVTETEVFETTVARDINQDQATEVRKLRLKGVRLVPSSRRVYPEGNLAPQVLGFLGRDNTGLTGLEADVNEILNGSKGSLVYERDGRGYQFAFGSRDEIAATHGADIVLTIDRYIQRVTEKALDEAIKKHKATGGSIIVIDPKTGEILALASRPTFDVTRLDLSNASSLDQVRNRAITDQYEPGSIFKLVTAAAALDAGLVTPETRWYDEGVFKTGGWSIYNWDYSSNGSQTVTQFLSKSLNTGAAWLAQLLGPERFYEYVDRFGFGKNTGIELTGEVPGQVRTPSNDSNWRAVDMATNSFGQGITATPLQMVTMLAAIANDGLAVKPHIIKEVVSPNGRQAIALDPLSQVISPDAASALKRMMAAVVDGIPKAYLDVKGYRVGGKTGTANIAGDNGAYKPGAYISSFAGIAPLDDPAIAVLVKIDEPKDVPWGTVVAAPAFGQVAQAALTYLRVPPEGPALVAGQR